MKHHPRLFEVLQRSETGLIMDEADFERDLVGPTIKGLIEKYDIQYTGEFYVNCDDELADRVYQAGIDFASEVGMYNQSTSRRITWTCAEIDEAIQNCRTEASLGQGEEQFSIIARKPEDTKRVALLGGVVGIPFPEELHLPLTLSFLKQNIFDSIDTISLETAYGYPIKAGTGWEVLGAWREAELAKEALEIVGKPGIPYSAVELAPTAWGGLAGVTWGGYRPFDRHHVATISEFKTNNDLLAVITHIHNLSGFIGAYYNPIYGGHVGGTEGIAVAVAAGMILLNQITVGHTFCTRPTHPFFGCDTTPEILWATSLGVQALTRNSDLMIATLAGPAGGPGTKTILYENAAFALMSVASGVSELLASHSAGGAVPRHGSGLDARICAEVTRTMPGLTRKDANELLSRIVPLYQADLDKEPIGKPFEEVYDVETVEPTAEWQGVYDEVRGELIAMGMPLDRFGESK
jgi:methylamine--corrinoid protein Co-methyltransferase|tara:strand:- start:735 stop:2129 length:1395 start_codon:yes stop_codon:yes gene_type:complete